MVQVLVELGCFLPVRYCSSLRFTSYIFFLACVPNALQTAVDTNHAVQTSYPQGQRGYLIDVAHTLSRIPACQQSYSQCLCISQLQLLLAQANPPKCGSACFAVVFLCLVFFMVLFHVCTSSGFIGVLRSFMVVVTMASYGFMLVV